MSEVEAIKARIRDLPAEDFACLRDWFQELDNERSDEQIASDFKTGKFNSLIERARAEFAQGKAREL